MAGIPALYGDASTAWRNTNDRYPGNKNAPRGSFVYWTGGSKGYGHVAISLGGGKVRSTDYPTSGTVGTADIGWFETHWGLPYAGWAWDNNEQTVPHSSGSGGGASGGGGKDDDVQYVTATANKAVNLKDGAWYPINWDKGTDGYIKVGQPGVDFTGPYSADLRLNVDRKKGGRLQVSWVEWDGNTAAETSVVDSLGEVSNASSGIIGNVQKGRVLRARVRIDGGQGGTLNRATLGLVVYNPK